MNMLDLMMQQQALQTLGKIQNQPQGLLGMSSPKQMGLLGATQGIQPYMGYTDKPVSLGQVLAGAGAGYSSGLQAGYQQDLEKSLGTLSALGTVKEMLTPEAPPGFTSVTRISDGKPVFVRKGEEGTVDAEGKPLYMPYQKPGMGFELITTPEGGIEFRQKPVGSVEAAGGNGVEKKITQDLQQKIITSGEQYDNLMAIYDAFDPSFLTWEGKLSGLFSSLKEKAGVDLSSEDQSKLRKLRGFERNVNEALNLYIKAITGAQMSEAEAQRLKKAFPNLDDSPTDFLAKLDALNKDVLLATARTNYFINNPNLFTGYDPNDPYAKDGKNLSSELSLKKMEDTILEKTEEFYQQIKGSTMDDQEARRMAIQQSSNFFGIPLMEVLQ